MNRDGKISAPPSLVTSGVLKLHHQQPSSSGVEMKQETVSCWMDIVAGTDPTGRPVETFLRVGQDATIVIRVRQQGKKEGEKKTKYLLLLPIGNWIVRPLHSSKHEAGRNTTSQDD